MGVLAATPTGLQSFPSVGIDQTAPGATNLVATNGVYGPYVGTLAKLGDSVTMPAIANGMGTYFIHIVTASGDQPFVGTFSSTDSLLGSGRRMIKNGAATLQVSSEALDGTQGVLDYRTTGGPGAQTVTCTAYSSGRATVYLYATASPTAPFLNGAVDTVQGAALRQARAFSASAMAQVAGGSLLNFLFANPAASGVRAVLDLRKLQTDNPAGQICARYYSLLNPTINLPALSAAARNRDNGAALGKCVCTYSTSTMTATADGGGGFPDQVPSVPLASRLGGIIPTGGIPGGPLDIETIYEPGSSAVISLLAVANTGGLATTNPYLSYLFTWIEEPKT